MWGAENHRNGRDASRTVPTMRRIARGRPANRQSLQLNPNYTHSRRQARRHVNTTIASLMIAALYHLPPPKCQAPFTRAGLGILGGRISLGTPAARP